VLPGCGVSREAIRLGGGAGRLDPACWLHSPPHRQPGRAARGIPRRFPAPWVAPMMTWADAISRCAWPAGHVGLGITRACMGLDKIGDSLYNSRLPYYAPEMVGLPSDIPMTMRLAVSVGANAGAFHADRFDDRWRPAKEGWPESRFHPSQGGRWKPGFCAIGRSFYFTVIPIAAKYPTNSPRMLRGARMTSGIVLFIDRSEH